MSSERPTKVAAEGGQSLHFSARLTCRRGVSTAVKRAISQNFGQKTCQTHRNGWDFEEKNNLAALNTIISYRSMQMVNDFEFIQPFGGNRVPIDLGRKSQKEI
jgi:hypothetical protein